LAWEIEQSGQHPATWEKKGSSLYTTQNVVKYQELRQGTNRLLNKIRGVGGHVFYTGIEKDRPVERSNAKAFYLSVLSQAMRKLDQYAREHDAQIMIIMDKHQDREASLTRASQAMYGKTNPRRRIIEPPFQVESHRYQTCQCADWLCGLIGRIGAFQARRDEWNDMAWIETYFLNRVQQAITEHSGIRLQGVTREISTEEELAVVVASETDAIENGEPAQDVSDAE